MRCRGEHVPPNREPTPSTLMRPLGPQARIPDGCRLHEPVRDARRDPVRQRIGLLLRADRLVCDDERPAAERAGGVVAAIPIDVPPARGSAVAMISCLRVGSHERTETDSTWRSLVTRGLEVEQCLAPGELDCGAGIRRRGRGRKCSSRSNDADLADRVGEAPRSSQSVSLPAGRRERRLRPPRSSRPSVRCAAPRLARCRRSSSPGRCRCACGAGYASGRTRARRESPHAR